MLITDTVFREYLTDVSFSSTVLHELRIDYLCAPTMLVLSVELPYALVLLDVELILFKHFLHLSRIQGQILLLVSCYSHIHRLGHACRTHNPADFVLFLADPLPLFSSDPDNKKVFFTITLMIAVVFASYLYIWVQIDELHA